MTGGTDDYFTALASDDPSDMSPADDGQAERKQQRTRAYDELIAAVNAKYRQLTGANLPSAAAKNLSQLLAQIMMVPASEPEHGPGLWAKVPQTSLADMVEARPIDLTGSPTRMDVDLMTLHTIRMGRFLTMHYTDWAQTLPACWLHHDDVVQEVYALKCYMDLTVASPTGGLYAPTLQSLIRSALERVKGYLDAAEASNPGHKHHMSAPEARQREQERHDEYLDWFKRDGGWQGESPFDKAWNFLSPAQGLDAACDLVTPTHVESAQTGDDGTWSKLVDHWRAELSTLHSDYMAAHDSADLTAATAVEGRMRRMWLDYTARERSSRDRLDRAVTSATMLLRDPARSGFLTDPERAELSDLIDSARHILHGHGRSPSDEGYEPCSIDLQDRLASRLERLAGGDPAAVFDRCTRMLEEMDDTFARGWETTDERPA